MNAFKKLALAAAVASVPMVGVAMEPLNDEGLSNVTGQDGITLSIDLASGLELNAYIEDTDGLQDGTRDEGGLIAIQNLLVNTGSSPIEVTVDAGSAAGAGAGSGVLRLGVDIGELTISGQGGAGFTVGVAGVSDSGTDTRDAEAGWTRVTTAQGNIDTIMTIEEIALGGVGLDIELGPEAQGMALSFGANAKIDEILLTNFEIGPEAAQVHLDEVLIRNIDLGGTTGQVTGTGLALTLGGSSAADIALMGVKIGDMSGGAPALGNVYVDGLDMSGAVITVSGH